jgi:hypothetical protein
VYNVGAVVGYGRPITLPYYPDGGKAATRQVSGSRAPPFAYYLSARNPCNRARTLLTFSNGDIERRVFKQPLAIPFLSGANHFQRE